MDLVPKMYGSMPYDEANESIDRLFEMIPADENDLFTEDQTVALFLMKQKATWRKMLDNNEIVGKNDANEDMEMPEEMKDELRGSSELNDPEELEQTKHRESIFYDTFAPLITVNGKIAKEGFRSYLRYTVTGILN